MRHARFAMFAMFLAAQSCPVTDCFGGGSCSSASGTTPLGTVDAGSKASASENNCSTCGHSGVEVTWTAVAGTSTVQVDFSGDCGGTKTKTNTSTAAPSAGSVSVSNVPSADDCGETAVRWTALVSNNSTVAITNLNVRITCPVKGGSSAPAVGPTRVGVR